MVTSDLPNTVSTHLEWQDLILDFETMRQVETILSWAPHSKTLLQDWKLGRLLTPGYLCLFHGASGTGKTLAACLIARQLRVRVCRIDLARDAASLEDILEKAGQRGWILLFEEADALFGKRTEVKSSHDRYANQQVSYLLQRLERYPGIVIFESNLQSHLDAAFARRFQSVIHFTMPSPTEREELWRAAFGGLTMDDDVDFKRVAEEYALAGGSILNVLRYAALMAADRRAPVCARDVHEGARRELEKVRTDP